MPGLMLIAFIGLLLLAPIEMLLLIVLALLKSKSRRFPEPILKVPEVRKVERYGWEDYLKLPPERKSSGRQNQAVLAAILALMGLLVIGPAFLFFPSLIISQNATAAINATPVVDAAAEASNLTSNSSFAMPQFLNLSHFANISVSHAFKLPSFSFMEGSASSYTPYVATAVLVIAFLGVCLGAFMLFLRSKRNAVLRKAKKTAEKLIRKDAASPKFIEKLRPYFFPAAVLLLLVIIALLVYFLRGRIRAEFAPWVYGMFASVANFLVLYRFYVLAGIVLLAAVVAALRYFSSRGKKQ